MSSTTDLLTSLLTPSSIRIRTVGFKLVKLMTKLTGNMLTKDDVQHFVLSAAFEAFLDLGGNPDAPEAFDWAANELTLEKRGLRWLRKEVVGRKSEFGEVTARLKNRKNSAFVDCYRWTAWTYENFNSSRAIAHNTVGFEYTVPSDADKALQEEEVGMFVDDLKKTLNEREFQWLIERYVEGLPQSVQIDRLVSENPEYQTADGRKRAEGFLNVAIWRARERAKAVLGDKWREIAKDVAA